MAINNPTGDYPDFIIKNIQQVNTDFTPVYNFDSSISGATIPFAKGRLFDSGGQITNYSGNEKFYFVLRPKDSSNFNIFISYLLSEPGADFLKIYYANSGFEDSVLNSLLIDGTGSVLNSNTTLVGTLNASISNSSSVINSTNLIFTWTSNASTQFLGYDITWSSDGISNPIPTLFSIDGPLNIKGSKQPYTMTISKTKER